jgi:hypothetical protein
VARARAGFVSEVRNSGKAALFIDLCNATSRTFLRLFALSSREGIDSFFTATEHGFRCFYHEQVSKR